MEQYSAAANKGDINAQYQLGVLFKEGKQAPKDFQKAAEWFLKAANKGHPKAQHEIGRMYNNGEGVPEDDHKAMEWYLKASNQGNGEAMASIGVLYECERGVLTDYKKAFEWYQKSANAGYAEGYTSLGGLYAKGHGVPEDYAKAIESYEKAASLGSKDALMKIADLYLDGRCGVTVNQKKGIDIYTDLAQRGEAQAQGCIGMWYQDGSNGLPQDYKKAREWLQKAADQDHIYAQFSLGALYHHGHGVTQDFKKAKDWYLKSSQPERKYNYDGYFNIGILFEEGKGVPQSYQRAMEYFLKAKNLGCYKSTEKMEKIIELQPSLSSLLPKPKTSILTSNFTSSTSPAQLLAAAKRGDANASFILGTLYKEGKQTEKNLDKAEEHFRNAADEGHALAQYKIGRMYQSGEGCMYQSGGANPYLAMEYYKQSAEQGNAKGQNGVGEIYSSYSYYNKDYKNAMAYFRRASNQGYAKAQYNIGNLYYFGHGVKPDFQKAEEWYLKAANQGNSDAQVRLGEWYIEGSDYRKAKEWFQKATDNGRHEYAPVGLGLLYLNGQGVQQDYKKAMELFVKGASLGCSDGHYQLGVMYNEGRGAPQDYKKALEYFIKAANDSEYHGEAQMAIGKLYEEGKGTKRDYQQALDWYQKAVDNRCAEAEDRIEEVKEKMKSEPPSSPVPPKQSPAPVMPKQPSLNYEFLPANTTPAPITTPTPPQHLTPNANTQSPQLQLPSKVADWSVNDVVTWMTSLKLSQSYSDIVTSNYIDGDALLGMKTKEDWKDLGISRMGDIIKLTNTTPSAPTQSFTPAPTASESQKPHTNAGGGSNRLAQAAEGLEDVTYKPVLKLLESFKPPLPCHQHMINDLPSILESVPNISYIIRESMQVAESCLQHLPANIPRLSPDEALAIAAFTYDLGLDEPDQNFYFSLNVVLRERSPLKMKGLRSFLSYLMSGISKLPDLNITAYRGLPPSAMGIVEEKYKQGHNVHWSGFTSTTNNIKTAQRFAGKGGILMRINTLTGKSIKPYSAIQAEDEVLLSPNCKLLVTKKAHPGGDGFFYVDLVECVNTGSFVF